MLCLAVTATPRAEGIDQSPLLDVNVQAQLLVEDRDGKQTSHRYVPAQRFEQGQVLYYTVRIRNADTMAIKDPVVTRAIPPHTHYVAHSATGAGAQITFSVDGGKSFAEANSLQLSSASFSPVAATPSVGTHAMPTDYTHIRWRLRHPLEPGAVVLARFRAVFD